MRVRVFTFLVAVALFISCTSSEDDTPREEPNVEVEVVFFNHTFDAAMENFVWEYEVKFHNRSSFEVHGGPLITYTYEDDDSIEITRGSYRSNNPCPSIEAGETCTVSFYQEGKVDYTVEEEPTKLKFVKAEYFVYPEGEY